MKKQIKKKKLISKQFFQLYISVLIVTFCLASCNTAPDNNNSSLKDIPDSIPYDEKQHASLDSIVNYLLNASAQDFHDHLPPVPVNFRNVQVRNLTGPNTENRYLLCGQFLSQEKQSKDEWTSFATIKTSAYEQWIGNNLSYCQDSKAVSYKINDLSSELKSRFDALNNVPQLTK